MRKAVSHLKKADPVLAAIIAAVGACRIQYVAPTFESLARSVVYQQLNGKVAAIIYGRLTGATGIPLTPQRLLKLSPEQLRALGLSQQKSSYLRDLAERTAAAELDFEILPTLSDDQVIAALTTVKGIGTWTAQMFLMFALQRPNILPTGDLGIRTAMQKAYGMEQPPLPAEMQQIAQPWAPYRSIASWYLWRSLDIKTVA